MTAPRAVIFDMDETLVNTRALWQRAERALFETLGGQWTEEKAASYKGRNVADVAAIIHELCGGPGSREEAQKTFRSLLFEAFAAGPIGEMPGAGGCVRTLGERLSLAVASGSPLPLIERALDALGVRSCFSVLISSESVARGKPEPDVFLAAARALGVPAPECWVVEDSLAGARAARAAGMECLVVPSFFSSEMRTLCRGIFSNLDEVANFLMEHELWIRN